MIREKEGKEENNFLGRFFSLLLPRAARAVQQTRDQTQAKGREGGWCWSWPQPKFGREGGREWEHSNRDWKRNGRTLPSLDCREGYGGLRPEFFLMVRFEGNGGWWRRGNSLNLRWERRRTNKIYRDTQKGGRERKRNHALKIVGKNERRERDRNRHKRRICRRRRPTTRPFTSHR